MDLKIILLTILVSSLSYAKSDINGMIAGGGYANLGDFPHHVHLQIYYNTQIYICGGVFVHYNWILTSAHCVVNFEYIQAYIGLVDRVNGNIAHVAIIQNDKFVRLHPDYNPPSSLSNDIAMIFVENGSEAWLNEDSVGIIDLPQNDDDDFSGKSATATGFGRTSDESTSLSELLKYVNMTVIGNDLCSSVFPEGLITDDKLCTATEENRSTCPGDNGGGLFIEDDNGGRTLIGIGSFYVEFCQRSVPAVFARVSKFIDWIKYNFNNPPEVDTETTIRPPNRDCNCECICETCPSVDFNRRKLREL